ncbi:TRAP transporter small permease [Falsiroseomonas sp. CW058]|uniref:TRAP transporter small permease n=1 Tax=Falsiroseomonas sp. CW058 TaxID=3388664 RepID=UPI003D31C538
MRLPRIEEGLSILLGVLLFATVLWQVFTRYVLNDPSGMSEELARYLYVGVVFFGASAAVADRSHVGIPFLVEKLPPLPRLAAALLVQALVLAFCLGMVWWGWRAAGMVWDLPSEAMEIPTGLVLGIVPVSCAFMALRVVAAMAEDIAAFRRGGAVEMAQGRDF